MAIPAMKKINEYHVAFSAICPNNNANISYELTIETDTMIMVEEISAAVTKIQLGYHEEIAAGLLREFGGKQTLVAHHHGVDVKTIYEYFGVLELTTEQAMANLQKQYGGYWGEHPDFPAEDWASEATNNDTRQSYWDWVASKVSEAAESQDPGPSSPQAQGASELDTPLEVKEALIAAGGYRIVKSEFGGFYFELGDAASHDYGTREEAVAAAYSDTLNRQRD